MARLLPSALAAAAGGALLALASVAHAVPLNNGFAGELFLDTALPGTTVAARPELAGDVLVELIQPFSYPALNISGYVQSRVVREDVAGTLDFSWHVIVDPGSSPDGIAVLRLGNFGYEHLTDADWRIDGSGTEAPLTATLFNPDTSPGGSINFVFDPTVQPGDPSDADSGSKFFFLHTDATHYKRTAFYDLLAGDYRTLSPSFETFAPSTPEPGSLALLAIGAALTGIAARRR